MASQNESRPSPPPVRSPQGVRVALVAGAAMIALAVLIIIITSNRAGETDVQGTLDPQDFAELTLDPLNEEERRQSSENPDDINVRLTEGAFISGFSEDGRLVQRYTADRISPLPNREIEMDRPLAFLYLDDGRIVSMTGDRARVRRVQRGEGERIESGHITDNVVIQVFEPRDGVAPDPARDEPAITIETNEAELNDPGGEIRCDGVVHVTSNLALFTGTGLSILYDKVSGIERLTVEESEPIRIFAAALRQQQEAGDGATHPAGSNADGDAPRQESERRGAGRPADSPIRTEQPPARGSGEPAQIPSSPTQEASSAQARGSDKPERFYKLTLMDQVTISRGAEGARQTVTGDRMDIVFAMNNRDAGTSARRQPVNHPLPASRAVAHHSRRKWGATPSTLFTMLALSAVGMPLQDSTAISAPIPSDEDIIVAFTGRLVMVPVTERADRLPSADAVRLTLTGTPVRIFDDVQQAEAVGSRIVYTSVDERVRLTGNDTYPLQLSSPDLTADAAEFAFALNTNVGYFQGAGTMNLREQADARAFGPQQDPQRHEAEASDGLDIRWSRGVELQFVRDTDRTRAGTSDRGGRLRLATFRGDVVVRNVASDERFRMNTDELTVAFADEGTGEAESVRYIEANGNVVVEGLDGQASTLLGDALRLDFEWNDELEQMSPRTLVVTGNASASDETQSINAEKLTVTLFDRVVEAAEGNEGLADSEQRRTRVELDTLLAEQRVTVRLQDGLTVTGDRLFAVATSEHAEMTGLPVRIVGNEGSTNFVAVGSQATIDRLADGNYRVLMNGGGNLRMNRAAATDEDQAEAESSVEQLPPLTRERDDDAGDVFADAQGETLVVEWEDSLQYDEFPTRNLARVDVRGKVKAVSRPTPLEESTIKGEKIVMELDVIESPDGDRATESTAGEGESAVRTDDSLQRNRQLRSFTAHGAPATLESRVWTTAARTEPPKVHYIEGKLVSFDSKSRDAEVIGQGSLLVQDLTPPRPGEPEPDFGERGSTMFEWIGGMTMKEVVDGRYDLTMMNDVTMRHRGLDGRTATLQAPRLEVTARQRDTAASPGGLDFGGEIQLVRFIARATEAEANRRVLLESLGNTINANSVDYNYETGLMQIRGTQRNPAMFSTERQITPTRASEILWDLRSGTIRFRDASTTTPR